MPPTLRKIAAGHYVGARGVITRLENASGPPCARYRNARWLITYTDGRVRLARTLADARYFIS